jgi:hypothetical protein
MKDPVKTQRRESREEVERQLDEALEDSFPASDPLAANPPSAGRPDHPPTRDRWPEGRRG